MDPTEDDAAPPLNPALLNALVDIALANVTTTYPFHLTHLANEAADIREPAELHPVFFGSYDWHSCVHMHWTLARALRGGLGAERAAEIAAHFDARLAPAAVAGEVDYFRAPGRATFERPYGWGWLLQLCAEFDELAATTPGAASWRERLAPLAALLAQRCIDWLQRADYPVRAGTHGNSAFALLLARNYAQRTQHRALLGAVERAALKWFSRDRAYPAAYEPGGDDFLSGGLTEALLVSRVLDDCDFADWWQAFAPPADSLAHWLAPARVSDAADAKIVHLHGLNLSRAWCWRSLQNCLPRELQPQVRVAIEQHLAASLAAATAGDYVGTHWLASFALLALTGDQPGAAAARSN